jgi:hypothetical protein
MRYLYILFAVLTISALTFENARSQENIRGVFFENNTPHMLGVRLINRNKRFENVYMFQPGEKTHVDTKHDKFTMGAQLITPSYPIDCCEWKQIRSGGTLIVEYNEKRDRCYCRIK